MFVRGPIATRGQRIGLLGGSFDPPHEGHLHISRWALRACGLDRVWWLVSPGNPLKPNGPAEIDRRVAACRKLADHPRIDVTDIERHLGSPYTAHTLRKLSQRYPGVRFVWLMGADNLADFHRWEDWDRIARNHALCVLARPDNQVRAGLSKTARRFARGRLPPSAAGALGRVVRPSWCLLTGPMSPLSSTSIRQRGRWS